MISTVSNRIHVDSSEEILIDYSEIVYSWSKRQKCKYLDPSLVTGDIPVLSVIRKKQKITLRLQDMMDSVVINALIGIFLTR